MWGLLRLHSKFSPQQPAFEFFNRLYNFTGLNRLQAVGRIGVFVVPPEIDQPHLGLARLHDKTTMVRANKSRNRFCYYFRSHYTLGPSFARCSTSRLGHCIVGVVVRETCRDQNVLFYIAINK